MAGVAGIEPTSTVLETAALPLNYTPIKYFSCFYLFSLDLANFNWLWYAYLLLL